MSLLTLLVAIVAAAIAAYFALALGLVASQGAVYAPPQGGGGPAFDEIMRQDLADLPPLHSFTARDRATLHYRRYDGASPSRRIVILVHGSAWHGMQFHEMAKALSGKGVGTMIVPDMRGHGSDPVRRGDIDHIGQLEEDMADLIDQLRSEQNDTQIVLGGHSSGGGFVVRFAGGDYGDKADAFILMAPFLKHDASTTRPNAGGWARPAVRRIIGLTMLNAIGIRNFNYLPVISFAMPRAVMDGPLGDTATTVYSYRLHVSFAPRPDFGNDLDHIGDRPLLVLAGAADESFIAEKYEPVISAHATNGTYHVLAGVNHLGVVSDEKAIGTIADWLKALPQKD